MKRYPTIPKSTPLDEEVWVFDKLDGSNIRVEWTRAKGFSKFGSRKRMLGEDQGLLAKAEAIFRVNLEDTLEARFKAAKWQKVITFCEFHGPRSFAGKHHPDDAHTLSIIDISVHRKGILHPRDLLELTKGVHCATLLHQGVLTPQFVQDVVDGNLEGVTDEGVVCKGRMVSPGRPLMFKIKSRAWLDRLTEYCDGDEELFDRLA